MTYKLAIVGSRSFSDKEIFKAVLNFVLLVEGIPDSVISGGAAGADTLAAEWASENYIELVIFKPKHKDFPKKTRRWMAPKERNTEIVDNSDVILSFWDMKSTGTRDSIEKAIKKKCRIYVYNTIEKIIISNKEEIEENLK